ncbi:MAG: alpha-L-fucosidase [Bacteroidales bacterium]|nr:alpha-L-fucosidase [Bacteroidales bacterium]
MNKQTLKYLALLILPAAFFSCHLHQQAPTDINPNAVVPSEELLRYQQMELIGFIHFTVNTFTNKEWGYGDEDPAIFYPEKPDTEQWVLTAKAAGIKELILTAKHHDGFCLWPSKFTEHSIKNSPYKKGKGDMVEEFVRSCRKHGLKAGLYLSPWDRNHKDYGRPEYITYYKNQLKELLTEYGEINEIWFDGANGGDGYYGGANETRKIDAENYYGWDEIFALVKSLQPDIKIFSDAGPDVHWIGNEQGFAGFTFWSTINTDSIVVGKSDVNYLNTGDPEGKDWVVGQCDVSIRPGWFYHKTENSLVKTPQDLIDIYYKSVGRNAVMLLNLPPDQRGLIHENDVQSLFSFRQILDESFADDLAKDAKVTANNYRLASQKFAPENVIDNNSESYWATDDSILPAQLILQLHHEITFDRILIQEPVKFGQRVCKFIVQIEGEFGPETIFEGTTIGYKRLIRIRPVRTNRVSLIVLEANNTVAISNISLFKASEKEGQIF